MEIDEGAIARNMAVYGPFAATERVLMALVAAGASRQEGHEWIRQASLRARETLRQGQGNPLVALLVADERIGRYLTADRIRDLMDATAYTGTAAARASTFARELRQRIAG
jgi:adenylosuccinate lyase